MSPALIAHTDSDKVHTHDVVIKADPAPLSHHYRGINKSIMSLSFYSAVGEPVNLHVNFKGGM